MFAKKSLGQNFLNSPKALSEIVEAARLSAGDIVLEVGPGKGILTEKLLESGAKVVTVEKDRRLVPLLQERFASALTSEQLILIEGDILENDLRELGFKSLGFKVVANIPYYITGEFLRKLLSEEIQPTCAILLVQKEVAERIARSQKESLLSLSVKAYGKPKFVATVPRGAFSPTPSVDSAVLAVEGISKAFFEDFDENFFFKVLKVGFGQKRKQLLGNLSSLLPKEMLASLFLELNLPLTVRAEDISLSVWKELIKRIKLSTKSSYEDDVSL